MTNKNICKMWKKDNSVLLKIETDSLNGLNAKAFKDTVFKLSKQQAFDCLIVDFTSVYHVDTEALTSLLSILNYCRKSEKNLILSSVKSNLNLLIEEKGMKPMLEIHSNVRSALEAAKFASETKKKQRHFDTMLGASIA